MEPGLPTASVVRSSQATPARRRGQPCIAANQPAADPLISPQARVQTSGATSFFLIRLVLITVSDGLLRLF
jgi:hypothetical protein